MKEAQKKILKALKAEHTDPMKAISNITHGDSSVRGEYLDLDYTEEVEVLKEYLKWVDESRDYRIVMNYLKNQGTLTPPLAVLDQLWKVVDDGSPEISNIYRNMTQDVECQLLKEYIEWRLKENE